MTTSRLPHNPSRGLEAPQVAQKEPRVLTKTEVKALQGVAQPDPRNAAIVEVLLQTGLRVGAKGTKTGWVALTSRAEKALKVRPQSAHRELFLSKRKAKPLYSADVRAMLRKLYEQASIRGATVHTLRHTFCTHHAAGHASLTTTQRYLNLVEQMMGEQLEAHAL